MNIIYDKGFFNEDHKKMFLKDLSSSTHEAYSRVLSRAKLLEKFYGKDLYEFNIYEIERLIDYLNPKTLSSVLSAVSIIQNYIRWAIEQDLRSNNLNPLDAAFGDDYYSKFIDKTNKLIFTKSEIDEITGGLVNYQDSAVVQAIFEGVLGKGYSELLNLKKSDIDHVHNVLTLTNRKIRVSDKLIAMLSKAAEEDIYHKNNGHPAENIKAPTSKLVDNEFVFRSAILNTKAQKQADSHLILRRLKRIASLNDQPFLTAINIRNSGMLYMAYQIYQKTRKFEKEEFDKICEHFNISKLKNSNDYNATRIRKEFLNYNKIEELYVTGEE